MHLDRMSGFDDAYEDSALHPESDAMPRWIQANARPFDLLSRSEQEEINMPSGQTASMPAGKATPPTSVVQ